MYVPSKTKIAWSLPSDKKDCACIRVCLLIMSSRDTRANPRYDVTNSSMSTFLMKNMASRTNGLVKSKRVDNILLDSPDFILSKRRPSVVDELLQGVFLTNGIIIENKSLNCSLLSPVKLRKSSSEYNSASSNERHPVELAYACCLNDETQFNCY